MANPQLGRRVKQPINKMLKVESSVHFLRTQRRPGGPQRAAFAVEPTVARQ